MRPLLFLLLIPSLAYADSVLFVPAKDLSEAEVQNLQKIRGERMVKSTAPVAINPAAIESTVVVLSVDGKDYRFVGARQQTGVPGVDSWAGRDGEAILVLSREGSAMSGRLVLGPRSFDLRPLGKQHVIVEMNRIERPIDEEDEPRRKK